MNGPHVDFVIFFVRSKPFDKNGSALIIHRYHKTICVSFDIEDDAISPDDTCIRVTGLKVRRILPLGLARFLEPRVEGSLHRALVFVSIKLINESCQRATSEDAHNNIIACSQNGYKQSFWQSKEGATIAWSRPLLKR